MGKWRTKRKNEQKRRKRRVFAAVHAELRAGDDAPWTPEAEEAECMRNEEERQRVHELWRVAVDKSNAAFQKQRHILEERQRLILAIRQAALEEEVEGLHLRRQQEQRTGSRHLASAVLEAFSCEAASACLDSRAGL